MKVLPAFCLVILLSVCVRSGGHDLPGYEPPHDPAEAYIERLEAYRLDQMEHAIERIDMTRKMLRRTRSTNREAHERHLNNVQPYIVRLEKQLKKLRKNDLSEFYIPLDIRQPTMYEIGVLKPKWDYFNDIEEHIVREVIDKTSSIIDSYLVADDMGKPKDGPRLIRSFKLIGYPTEHMIVDEPFVFHEVMQVIGVENNEIYILHPVIFEDGTAFYPPKE